MKKIITAIILSVAVLALLAGCTAQEAPEVSLTEFISPAGYTVMHPAELTPTSLSSSIDFVVMDEKTATNVSIKTLDKISSFAGLTEEIFVENLKKENMDITVSSFERTTINEMDAIVAEYTYKESKITNIIYDAPEHLYLASYTELPGTSGELREQFKAIIYSLKA